MLPLSSPPSDCAGMLAEVAALKPSKPSASDLLTTPSTPR
jgi:hypothetical protein